MSKQTPINLSKHEDTILSKQQEQRRETPSKSQEPDDRLQKQVESINLKASDGNVVELTSSKLDRLFATIESNNKKNEETTPTSDELVTSQLLSRFGLKSSSDVIKFLRTPAGESVISMIGEKLAEIASIKEYQRQEMVDAQTRHSRMLGYLLLGLLYKKDAKSKDLNETIQQQIDKQLQHAHEVSNAPAPHETYNMLRKELDTLNESAKYLQSSLDDKNEELEQHNRELHSIKQDGLAIEERYSILENNILELDSFAHPKALANEPAHLTIANKISELESKIDNHAEKISKLLAEKKTTEARKMMHEHEGLHLQVGGLKHMLAAHNREKTFFDAEGQETSSYKDAAFVLSPDLKIVKDDGKYYLLGAKQNLTDLNEAEKAQAQSRFDKLKPEISSVKNLVKHNCKLEKAFHGERLESAEKRGHSLTSEMRLLRNQLHHVKAAQANIANEMNKANPDLKKAQGLQNAMPNAPSGASTNRVATPQTKTLEQALKAMQLNPNKQTVTNFTSAMTNVFGQVDRSIRQDLNKIVPGRPIPEAVMRSINQSIYKLKLPTNVPNPAPERQAPSPFKTKPTPY